MNQDYWQKQEVGKALFPDIEWNKPEQKSLAGKLLIVGGSTSGFSGLSRAFSAAEQTGVGETKLALPKNLEKFLGDNKNCVFLPINGSGGIGKDALDDLFAASEWSDGILLAGDCGQNSETAILFEKLLTKTAKWTTVTRDAADLLIGSGEDLVNRPQTNLVLSFAQTQKLFRSVYYPKMLTFSMSLSSAVEALAKFTITYPVSLTVTFNDQTIVANNGQVVSQNSNNNMKLIDASLATRCASYLLWSPQKPLEALASAIATT